MSSCFNAMAVIILASSECSMFRQRLGGAATPLQNLLPPTEPSSARSCPQRRSRAFRLGYAAKLSSTSSGGGAPSDAGGRHISAVFGGAGHEVGGSFSSRWRGFVCKAGGENGVGSSEWMSKATTPYGVLGVSPDSSEEEIKSAFRARIKEYHPDVYQGLGDADAITQRLLRAYEFLTGEDVERTILRRKSFDPFEEPECIAEDVFVNELACIGRGCPYSCVERAPDVFQFAPETGRARAQNQYDAAWKGEYHVQLAVGQCPRNCIHYVTPEQRFRLEEILYSVLEGTVYSGEVAIMDGLIARARFENGRYQVPKEKRKPKKSDQWVDWY